MYYKIYNIKIIYLTGPYKPLTQDRRFPQLWMPFILDVY